MELNTRAKGIIELAKKYSNEQGILTIGTEYLILAMYETKDSLCHFLLEEYDISHQDVLDKTNEIFVLRKKEGEYNNKLETILNQASILAKDNLVSEEHLFMAVLMVKNTIAEHILISLGLNIEDLINDVKEIYDFYSNNTDELSFVKNITKLAKNNELALFIKRNNYLNKIDVIMNRRFKNNPLLIGNAGVGKTALVEGYAKMLIDNNRDLTILSLNITAMLAGTRYRGDFEERFDKFVKEIASKKNVCIFIDEIHTIMGAATTEGNLDVANMLKPFLARNDIRLIGATTLDEYHKSIAKDKALCRRFQPVFISEPSLSETKDILFGIRDEYEKYHNVKITDEVLEYLLYQSDKKLVKRFRPDKCIDVLDEAMSYCSINRIEYVDILDIDRIIEGNIYNVDLNNLNNKKLAKYLWLYNADLIDNTPLLKILSNNSISTQSIIEDIMNMFNIGYEAVLEIDLSGYRDSYMLTTLIGAPPGYVGYEDEGILSRHVLEYPISLVCFKSFDNACAIIKSFILNLLARGSFNDQRGRAVMLNNTIIIVEGMKDKNSLGFNSKLLKNDLFDEYIDNNINAKRTFNDKYISKLKRLSYEVSFDFDIDLENKKIVDSYLFDLLNDKKDGKFLIKGADVLQK